MPRLRRCSAGLIASFRSAPAAGQLRRRSQMVLSREVRHALNADVMNWRAPGVENSDNGRKGIGPGREILWLAALGASVGSSLSLWRVFFTRTGTHFS